MRKASKYEQALDYFTKAQNIIDINHIKNPELTSDIYNDMGVIYINLDIFDKALANYQKIIKKPARSGSRLKIPISNRSPILITISEQYISGRKSTQMQSHGIKKR